MTYRQKMLKAVYPALMWFTKLTGKNTKELSNKDVIPPVSFYTLQGVLNNGDTVLFNSFRDKKVLLVNTASDCGYTNQYEDLQKLSEQYKDKLVVIGFPANDFKEQEKRADKDIAEFCKLNFGVTFPLMQKSIVIKSAQQNPVFQWLSDSTKNGWNKRYPSWNFSKYLVNEKGVLTNYFGSSVSPLSKEVVAAIME
ncbi:MAG: glutathione peroxidase [Chitinophagaceae bacterium]|nr:glutathione peroxidase [Chitinophagaceae bacterium]